KRKKPNQIGNSQQKRGIIRTSALWTLCRRRHKAHWTRHPRRLDRSFGRKRWGDEGYAQEELVAELGAAFLAADLGSSPEPREEHAAYIAHWLEGLRNDKRFIFQAAAHAQKAVDYLHELQPKSDEVAV
ncbi:MAG: zincin-like metallopeptidase domain-containing protein, partial [Sulfitobacter sp.]|uniref:zincin-like metallopeptidase domain-containing protein n=1 Tax=Celeribacter marinus TaxID=1397108 RepID=UPI00317755F2